jgi:hypothetical protein
MVQLRERRGVPGAASASIFFPRVGQDRRPRGGAAGQ